jgi:photosystem II stability/assembly factor-like uncharacterized protein
MNVRGLLLVGSLLLIAILARNASARSCLGPGIASIVVDRSSDAILIATRNGYLFRSTDGERWTRSTLPSRLVCSVDLDPVHPSTYWASAKDGIFKSVNDGKTWSSVVAGVQRPTEVLAIHPFEPSIIYAGRFGEVIKSGDGGATWRTIFDAPDTLIDELVVDPKNPDIAYAGLHAGDNRRLMKTVDGGKTWKTISEGKIVDQIMIDRDAIYVVFDDQFAVSRDSGRSWQPLPVDGIPTALITHAARPGTLYAGFAGPGLYDPMALRISTDGGKSWSEVYPFARGVDFVIRTKRLLLVSGKSRIFISSDGGRNFRRVLHEITAAAGVD